MNKKIYISILLLTMPALAFCMEQAPTPETIFTKNLQTHQKQLSCLIQQETLAEAFARKKLREYEQFNTPQTLIAAQAARKYWLIASQQYQEELDEFTELLVFRDSLKHPKKPLIGSKHSAFRPVQKK